MPDGGPQSVLAIEQQTNADVKGKQIDLTTTFTNDFVDKASGLTPCYDSVGAHLEHEHLH